MTPETLTLILSVIMGGGGIAALIKARNEAPLVGAQAQNLIIQNLNDEVVRLQVLVAEQSQLHERRERELLDRIADLEDRLKMAGI